ncbi:MAG: hypothetical protein RI885_1657 [Actinomycetota bacterium]|jgi:endoglucanase
MSRARVIAISAIGVVAVLVAGGLAWSLTGAGRTGSPSTDSQTTQSTEPGVDPDGDPTRTAEELGDEFLADWVDDGRVVRRDQGDDTVSEGQAYGLLVAVGVSDETAFDSILDWTDENLVGSDGLMAWQWKDGEIVDDEPASDADLDVARALVLAGTEFGRPDLTERGNALAGIVLDTMTVQTAAGRILLPGQWAAAMQPYAYNPSYASPAAFAQLGASTGDPRWAELAAGSAAVTTAILDQTELPPDWAQVHPDGRVEPMPGPVGEGIDVRYSYDAARLPLRYAESCDAADVALAARLTSTLERESTLRSELDLGGGALAEAQHPLAYGARAAALVSSGDADGARADLRESVATLDRSPTYYGAAWAALAPLMLGSDTLGSCAPLGAA